MWCFCKKCIVIIIELFQNRNCHSLTLNKAKYLKHWLCYHKNVKEHILQKQKYGSNFNFLYTKNVGSLESSKEFSWVSSKRYFSFIWTYHKKQNILVTLYHNWDSQNQETWPSFRKVNDQIALLHFLGGGEGGSYLWDSYPCCVGYTYRTRIILLTELIKQSPFFMNIMLKHKLHLLKI